MAFKHKYKCEFCGKEISCIPAEVPEHCECEYTFDHKCKLCEYFTCQRDRNNDIALTFCKHPKNPSKYEGNTRPLLCPIYDEVMDEDDTL